MRFHTTGVVGLMWVITWGFWLVGAHTPMSFAAALVGCTGMGLIIGTILDAGAGDR
jgi:hypothetical protein